MTTKKTDDKKTAEPDLITELEARVGYLEQAMAIGGAMGRSMLKNKE